MIITQAISYRSLPDELTTREIIAELIWLGSSVSWPGSIGAYARERASLLRAELARREAVTR